MTAPYRRLLHYPSADRYFEVTDPALYDKARGIDPRTVDVTGKRFDEERAPRRGYLTDLDKWDLRGNLVRCDGDVWMRYTGNGYAWEVVPVAKPEAALGEESDGDEITCLMKAPTPRDAEKMAAADTVLSLANGNTITLDSKPGGAMRAIKDRADGEAQQDMDAIGKACLGPQQRRAVMPPVPDTTWDADRAAARHAAKKAHLVEGYGGRPFLERDPLGHLQQDEVRDIRHILERVWGRRPAFVRELVTVLQVYDDGRTPTHISQDSPLPNIAPVGRQAVLAGLSKRDKLIGERKILPVGGIFWTDNITPMGIDPFRVRLGACLNEHGNPDTRLVEVTLPPDFRPGVERLTVRNVISDTMLRRNSADAVGMVCSMIEEAKIQISREVERTITERFLKS